jgi:hypothetical protein
MSLKKISAQSAQIRVLLRTWALCLGLVGCWGGARWQGCGCLIFGFDDFQAQGARAQSALRNALKMSFLTLKNCTV